MCGYHMYARYSENIREYYIHSEIIYIHFTMIIITIVFFVSVFGKQSISETTSTLLVVDRNGPILFNWKSILQI